MRLSISHLTRYRYDAPVQYALQELRLTPKSRSYQSVLDWRITVEGGRKQAGFNDQHDNHVELISFEPGQQEITVRCEGEVETTDTHGIYGEHHSCVPLWLFKRPTDQTRPGPLVRKLVKSLGETGAGDVARMHQLSAAVAGTVAYETGRTHSASTAEEVLEAGHGVCQDHAHVFIAAARLIDLPARYVSGYLMMNDRVDQDASHAWAEVHVDGLGWVGFDVSNGISPDERYVRVATGLDYKDAAPVSGMRFGDSGESMMVTLRVQQQ
jgi:transglutaminase-like putative cysteine protease